MTFETKILTSILIGLLLFGAFVAYRIFILWFAGELQELMMNPLFMLIMMLWVFGVNDLMKKLREMEEGR